MKTSITPTLLVAIAILCGIGHADEIKVAKQAEHREHREPLIDLNIIEFIESSHNPMAYNSTTQAVGLYQITPICLADYNQLQHTNYTKQDLFNPNINRRIAKWYIEIRIPVLLRHYKKEVNVRNVIYAYHDGIGNLVKGKISDNAKNYWRKYGRISN